MNFCVGKYLGGLLGWLFLRDIGNKSKNQLYEDFWFEPKYFHFWYTILLWKIALSIFHILLH